jgi:Phosphoserine phosphatase RsbU, N-terminal domain
VDDLEALTRNYRITFLRYLPRHDEAALTQAYDLGRQAVAAGVSLLDILNIHHIVLAEILRETPDEGAETMRTAAAFFAEVVAPYDMVQRAFLDNKLDRTYRLGA